MQQQFQSLRRGGQNLPTGLFRPDGFYLYLFCQTHLTQPAYQNWFSLSDRLLQVMRPYQIVATERILGKINIANKLQIFNSPRAGVYILAYYRQWQNVDIRLKPALLASKLPKSTKCCLWSIRKDLDYQR
jgi:hypothetical protein